MNDFWISFFALLLAGTLISFVNYFLNHRITKDNYKWQSYIKNIEQLEKYCEKIRNLCIAYWLKGEKTEKEIAAHINILLKFIHSLEIDESICQPIKKELISITGEDFGTPSIVNGEKKSNNAIILIYDIQIQIQKYLYTKLA